MKTPVKKTKTPAIAQMVERRTVVFSKLLSNVFLRSLVRFRFAGRGHNPGPLAQLVEHMAVKSINTVRS